MGKVASSDRLYGSIHTHQVAEALKEQGFEIDHRKIDLHHPIKALGEYDITIKLYEGVHATVKLTVVPGRGQRPARRRPPRFRQRHQKRPPPRGKINGNPEENRHCHSRRD